MKKYLNLLLVVLMLSTLVACGGEQTPTSTPTETEAQTQVESESAAKPIKLGDVIEVDYFDMTLDAFEISDGYSFEATDASSGISITHKASIDCPNDMRLVCLRGKFTNKTTGDIFPANNPIYGEIIINGYTYKTEMDCYISETAESVLTLTPLRAVDYYLYAEVPANLANAIENCTLNFGFVNGLDASTPVFELSDNDVLYALETIPAEQ